MSAEEGMKQMLAKTDEHWLSRAKSVIDTFHTQRIHAAKLSRQVSQMERDRTLLRHKMVAELIAAGTAKTAAADQARLSPEYIQAGVVLELKQEEWETAMADAEHARMSFEIITMKVRDAYDAGQRVAELKGMESTLKGRIKELGG